MGRNQTRIPADYWLQQPRWLRNYHTEWSAVLGDRVRRMRRGGNLTLAQVAARLRRPDGGRYGYNYFSRLERGSSSPPLYVYLALAELFEVHPGRLLGVDDVERDATQEEMVLIRFLRRSGVTPDEALHALTTGGRPPVEREPRSDSPPPSRQEVVAPPLQELVKGRSEVMRLDFGITAP